MSRFSELEERLEKAPYSFFLAVACIPIGLAGMVLGNEISAAITNVLPGQIIPHIWGVVLVCSGLSTLYGIFKFKWLWEYVGLQLMSYGLGFYSVCCYLGLGLGGVVSGTLALAYAIASRFRGKALFKKAKAIAENGSGVE